jgi:DNA polymerase-3 subunit delta'
MTLLPWHAAQWERLVVRAAAGSLPHALLLTGAEGLGKRAFAERLAAFVLCQRRESAPCGQCRSCTLYAVRAQRDPQETRPDGSLAQPHGYAGHPDVRFVGYAWREKEKKMYTEIVVDQVRDLAAWLALSAQLGGAVVALIEPAEAMNVAAANALLKTLEEPNPGRYVILVSSHPERLPPTIRSRCQRIEFAAPPADVALEWLSVNGVARADAQAALEASGGNPGLALAWSNSGRLALRDAVAGDLRALHSGKSHAAEIASAWARAEPDARLWFAAGLVQREAAAAARRARGPLALTGATDLTKLAAWFDQANKARELLRGPLRPELVLIELLMAWQALAPRRSGAAA